MRVDRAVPASSTVEPSDMGAHAPEALGGDATPDMKAPEAFADRPEIEVTLGMIEAGDAALASYNPDFQVSED